MDNVGAKPRPKMVAAMVKLRKARGKTQAQVARMCRVTQATISRLENDPNARVTDAVAAKIMAWIQMPSKPARRLTARAA